MPRIDTSGQSDGRSVAVTSRRVRDGTGIAETSTGLSPELLPDNSFGRLLDDGSGTIETSTTSKVGAGSAYGSGLSVRNKPIAAKWTRADTPTATDGVFNWRSLPLHLGYLAPIAAASGVLAKTFDISACIFYCITIISEC